MKRTYNLALAVQIPLALLNIGLAIWHPSTISITCAGITVALALHTLFKRVNAY